MRPFPPLPGYTSVSGITSVQDVSSIAGGTETYTMSSFGTPMVHDRRLAITVLTSWETLRGEPARQHPERYARPDDIKDIFAYAASKVPYAPMVTDLKKMRGHKRKVRVPRTIDLGRKCLRVLSYESDWPELLRQLGGIVKIGGPHLDAIRLRMTWPNPYELRGFREMYPHIRLILQVNSVAYTNCARDRYRLAERLEDYSGSMTDILFEARGHDGRMLPLSELTHTVKGLAAGFPDCGICIAGGLDAASVQSLAPLLETYPWLSVDAESSVYAEDGFDDVKAREYIRGVGKVYPYAFPQRKRPR